MHHMERAGLVAAWRDAAFWHYKQQLGSVKVPSPAIVEIHIPVPDKRRRDPMNYCGTITKAVIDGLVLAGAWPDDTPEYVRHLEPLLTTEKEQVYVFIHPGGSRLV